MYYNRRKVREGYSGVLEASVDVAENLGNMITVDKYRELFRRMLEGKRWGKMEGS